MTSEGQRGIERARLRSEVTVAGRVLAPMWPLETFIAVNPLGGLEDRPFDEAIGVAADVFGARGTLTEGQFRSAYADGRVTDADLQWALARRCTTALAAPAVELAGRQFSAVDLLLCDLLHGESAARARRPPHTRAEQIDPAAADAVDAQTVKWCAAFLDAGQAGWPMPGRERGLYLAWRELAGRDRALARSARARLGRLPERPEDALLDALAELGVGYGGERLAYLRAHLARLPGWASHVRWRGEHGGGVDLVDFLALRLAYEAALLTGRPAAAPATASGAEPAEDAGPQRRAAHVAAALDAHDPTPAELAAIAGVLAALGPRDRPLVWLEAYERHYRDPLLDSLNGAAEPASSERASAQLVCCIDARSEGLRRQLEALGRYETLGFAGFFAVAIRFQDLAGGAPSALCPVLLEPRNAIRERPLNGAEALARRRLTGHRAVAGAEDAFHAAKDDLAAPFALAEASGWAAGPLAAAKTFAAGRYGTLRGRLQHRAEPPAPTTLTVGEGFTSEERALFAEVALTMMGLTHGFGRLVVLCGHGSQTENNPYEAALHCGACGGSRGGPNARTAAAILNGEDVRAYLATRGIAIPPDTWFVAAEHDTATDTVTLLDRHLVPAGHHRELDALADALAEAGARLASERCRDLPGAPAGLDPRAAARHVRARSTDWAQVFPEWGLAGNAAFVVGPRSLTAGLDLERRCFLHSYEADVDRDGGALETILTAPLVVAQWINCQYYFSTVDPVTFGAGTKTIHNVVGGIGVLAGQTGDLQLGLPWQSVADGDRLVHEPMRLLAVVQAPLERIDTIVARNRVLDELFGNGWVALAAREEAGDPWRRWTRSGWESWKPQEVGVQ